MKAFSILFIFLFFGFVWWTISYTYDSSEKLKVVVTKSLEDAYFEGQQDALEGDIRIQKDSCGNYIRIKSAWDEKTH